MGVFSILISIVTGIITGIVANFFTPMIGNQFGKRKKEKALKKTTKMKNEYEKVKAFVEKDEDIKEYMLLEIIKGIGSLAVGAFLISIFYVALKFNVNEGTIDRFFSNFYTVIIYVVAVFFLISVITRFLNVEILYYRVRNFKEYEQKVKDNVPNSLSNPET